MNHSLLRLASRIHNTPHLITQEAFSVILDYLDARNRTDFIRLSMLDENNEPIDDDDCCPEMGNGIGLLQVDGSLTYKPVMTMCGEVGTSYQSLVAQTQAMADAGIKTIVMEVSSGGGEASHCFQAASDIRTICDDNGITLYGYADEYACSAAYALLCISDVVIANPSATLGSIGCVVALLDTSKAYEQAGLKRIFVTSGANKVPFAADGSFKKEFLEEIQADVDRLNEDFAAHVASHTGLDVKTIKGFEAGTFDAATAVEKGLANAVMTNKQFADFLAAQVQKETPQ